ncbi:unnamed protein product [Musa acuminata subsp. burmannicoides]
MVQCVKDFGDRLHWRCHQRMISILNAVRLWLSSSSTDG